MNPIDTIEAFLNEVEKEFGARLVVRWIDEVRPVENSTGGYTVTNVQRLTLTGRINGEVRRQTFEDCGREEFSQLARGRNIELIMRSDNVGR